MDSSPTSSDLTWALASCALVVVVVVPLLLAWRRHSRRRRRAGCVPLRVEPGGRMSVALIQSRRHPDKWTFPAGGVERGERHVEAALRETREEAGLVGRLGRRICEVSDENSITTMFAMHVEAELDVWQESAERERRWFDLGAPTAPSAQGAFATVRAMLVKKSTPHAVLDACEKLRVTLHRETEQCERTWAPPPAHRQRRAAAAKVSGPSNAPPER